MANSVSSSSVDLLFLATPPSQAFRKPKTNLDIIEGVRHYWAWQVAHAALKQKHTSNGEARVFEMNRKDPPKPAFHRPRVPTNLRGWSDPQDVSDWSNLTKEATFQLYNEQPSRQKRPSIFNQNKTKTLEVTRARFESSRQM